MVYPYCQIFSLLYDNLRPVNIICLIISGTYGGKGFAPLLPMTRLRPYIILSITIAVTLTVAMSASANPQDRPPYVICQTSNYDPLESIQIVPVDNLNYNRREQIELSPNLLELIPQVQPPMSGQIPRVLMIKITILIFER